MNAKNWGTVERVSYTTESKIENNGKALMDQRNGPSGAGTHVLRIEFRGPMGERHTHDLPNGGFNVGNPSLQFLAYVGKRPSDIDGMALDMNRQIPLVRTGKCDYQIAQTVLDEGAERLEEAVWSPMAEHTSADETAGAHVDGGSDDDDGGPRVEVGDRGLRIHTK